MFKKFTLLAALIMGLAACATSQNYTAKLNGDVGKTARQLTTEYGTPTHVKRLTNGDEIFTYININEQVLPDPSYFFNTGFMTEDEMFSPFTYGGDVLPVGTFMGEVITDYCKTKFYLKNNIVTSWQWSGNSCVAL